MLFSMKIRQGQPSLSGDSGDHGMRFTKMEGCGNDYVYVDGRTDRPADPADAVEHVLKYGAQFLQFLSPDRLRDLVQFRVSKQQYLSFHFRRFLSDSYALYYTAEWLPNGRFH